MRRHVLKVFNQVCKQNCRLLSTQTSTIPSENYVRRISLVKSITSFRNILILQKSNEQKLKFPLVWLRDNCTCPECFHESSRSRVINWESFQVNPKLQNIVVRSFFLTLTNFVVKSQNKIN